jgi:CHASE2 domain-containing sensor protein
MERLVGATLEQTLQSGAMTFVDALPVLSAIAKAIDFAHAHGILHRDIKPSNVFLSRSDDARVVVKVLDFGVAHIRGSLGNGEPDSVTLSQVSTWIRPVANHDSSASVHEDTTRLQTHHVENGILDVSMPLTTPGEMIGTLPYLSPELLAGDTPSPASDVYAFGVLAYEVLVGQRPNKIRDLAAAAYQTPAAAHTLNPALSPQISRVLAEPLRRLASDRPRSTGEFVAALRQAHYLSAVQTFRRIELPRRRRLSAAVALVLCAAAWHADGAGWGDALENRALDARFRFASVREPDARILVVMIDDASLSEKQLLGDSADEFAERFEQIFAAGAKAIAIDLLLPQHWSQSQQFSRLVLRHADAMTLAALSGVAGQVTGPECIAGLTATALGPERASALFGFVNVDTESDGITRRAHLSFIDTAGARRDSFAARSVRAALGDAALAPVARSRWFKDVSETFLIDSRVETTRISTLSWSKVPAELERGSAIFRDKLVLVGGTFVGSGDLHRLSGQRLIPGVVLQAVVMDTILNREPVRELGASSWLPVLFVLLWGLVAQAVSHARYGGLPLTSGALSICVVASIIVFVLTGGTVPLVVPLVTVAIAGVTASLMRPFLRPYPRPETMPV